MSVPPPVPFPSTLPAAAKSPPPSTPAATPRNRGIAPLGPATDPFRPAQRHHKGRSTPLPTPPSTSHPIRDGGWWPEGYVRLPELESDALEPRDPFPDQKGCGPPAPLNASDPPPHRPAGASHAPANENRSPPPLRCAALACRQPPQTSSVTPRAALQSAPAPG